MVVGEHKDLRGTRDAGVSVTGSRGGRRLLVAIALGAYRSHQYNASAPIPSSDNSAVTLAPAVQYMPPGLPLYVGAELGVGVDNISAAGVLDQTNTLFSIGGALGAHVFVASAVSLDPELSVAYLAGSHAYNSTGTDHDDLNGFSVALSVGLSAWL